MESLPATVWAIPIATPIVTWTNVAVAAALILLDISISLVFKLGVARSLIIAAIRCVVQVSSTALRCAYEPELTREEGCSCR
jgi:hypothetical protein